MTSRVLVVALSALLLLAAVPSGAAARSPACQLPEPRVGYSSERIVVTLVVDLARCSWWSGNKIELTGELNQSLGGTGIGQGLAAFKVCYAVGVISSERQERVERVGVTRCKLRLTLDHAPVEVATYSGAFTLPWKDGEAEVPFEYDCISAAVAASCDP